MPSFDTSKSVGEQVLNYGFVSRASSFPLIFSGMGVGSILLLNRLRFQRVLFRASTLPLVFHETRCPPIYLTLSHPTLFVFCIEFTEPWLHVGAGLVGWYVGSCLGAVFDDTEKTMHRQLSTYVSLPGWVHNQLSAEDLATELKRKKLEELKEKFDLLSQLEEAEYKEQLAAMSEEELRESREKGRVRMM